MIRKFSILLLTFPFIIFAQKYSDSTILPGKEYYAGVRVLNAYRGVSFIIPRDWKGAMPPDQRIFLMSSHVKAGVGLAIFQSGVSESDIVQYLKQTQNLGDNVILKPVGEPKVSGSQISMEYTSMTNSGYALALSGSYQNTVVFLFAGPAKEKEYFKKLMEKLQGSVIFSKPDPSKLSAAWIRALSGKMLKKVSADDSEGAFPTVVHLCQEGKAQITLPGDPTNIGSNPNLIDGSWEVNTQGAQAFLVLTPSRGKTVQASLDVFGSYVILDGGRYFLTASDMCK